MTKLRILFLVGFVLIIGLTATEGRSDTLSWTNPTTFTDNSAIPSPDQTRIINYLRYKVGSGSWTYFAETRGGKTSWTGTLPVAEGVTAGYSVSAALLGSDGVERDSAFSPTLTYTRPVAGKTPEKPPSPTVSP